MAAAAAGVTWKAGAGVCDHVGDKGVKEGSKN